MPSPGDPRPTPSVSVIIATRNRRALLARALRSTLSQRRVDLEVIVVDDGSDDGTPEFLAGVDDGRLHVVRHSTSVGTSPAKNDGLSRAAGEWVAFLDDDDVWAPDKLAAQLQAAAADPAVWVCAGAVTVDGDLRPVGPWLVPPATERDRLLVTNVIPGGGSATLMKTVVLRDVGGFDPALAILNDWDLWIRLSEVGPWAGVQRPLVGYSVTSGALTQRLQGLRAELDRVNDKHRDLRARRGVELTPALAHRFEGQLHVEAGHRRGAIGLLVAGWREHDVPSLAYAGAAAISPRRLTQYWSRGTAWPPGWRDEALAWLDALPDEPAATSGGGPRGPSPGSARSAARRRGRG